MPVTTWYDKKILQQQLHDLSSHHRETSSHHHGASSHHHGPSSHHHHHKINSGCGCGK